MPRIREARPTDAPAVRAIYAPLVEHTAVSFEHTVPSVAQMADRMAAVQGHAPWLVAEQDGAVVAYAYGSPHRARKAYRWSVEVSAYVDADHRGQGHGRRLYRALFALLRLQGYVTALAGITLPNPASVGLHQAMGFLPVGVYPHVGFKQGAWHDVGWWSMPLGPRIPSPAPPRPLASLRDDPEFAVILGR